MMAVVLFGLFFVMVFLNIPVAVALGVSSLAGLTMGGFPLTTLTDTMYSQSENSLCWRFHFLFWQA